MATDEEVQEARERVERLRQELANNERARVDRENELANEITLKQLAAEEARLEAQLAQQGSSSTPEAVQRGAQSPIAAIQADIDRAVATQEAVAASLTAPKVEEPVDTTEEPPAPASPIPATPPVAPASTTKTQKGGK